MRPEAGTSPNSTMIYMILLLILFCGAAHGQNTSATLLPDAPTSQNTGTLTPGAPGTNVTAPNQTSDQVQQTKRILGIIPNFRAVSTTTQLPPQSVKEKFVTASQDSFDYSSLFLPAALAAYSQGTNATPEFHQGAAGYGRYFWHTFVDQTSENYFVEFIGPALTHEDSRYYTLGHGGFLKRTGYSLSRAVVTRSDSGQPTFNASEIIGAGASAGISNLYYPSPERTIGNTASKWGINVGVDAATFMFKEFWPDINRKFFHATD